MKNWKTRIEALGFHRWKYDKEIHLHCMAFRKTTLQLGTVHQDGLNIPQDASDEPTVSVAMDTAGVAMDTTGGQESFNELPFKHCEPENT